MSVNDHENEIASLNKRLQQVAGGFRQSLILLTANRYGIFDLLAGKPASAQDVAAAKSWDLGATTVFLNGLVAMGFLHKAGNLYSNTEISQKLLVAGTPDYQGDILKHNLNLLEYRWIRLHEVLKSGKPASSPAPGLEAERLHNFIAGMANSASLFAPSLWNQVDLSSYQRLLDVGGGPGSYAFEACKRFLGLEAVVFDLPAVEPIFDEYHAKSGLEGRVAFHGGDYLEEALPGGFDVALLSNIIHSLGEEENLVLLGKIRNALLPGGLLILKDFFISEDGTEPLWTALFAMNMVLGTESGNTYTRAAVEKWLSRTGFSLEKYFDLSEQTGVLLAKKIG
jgi:SAM-dependent methyltransferase